MALPPYIEERIRRPPPEGCHIIPQSTPVIAFGNARVSRAATLGLNPSKIEFEDETGHLLNGTTRRLSTHLSLGINDLQSASQVIVERVLTECDNYFHNNPYRRWFDRLLPVLRACGASYYDGTACHLDLIQWATNPTWSSLPPEVRSKLISEDFDFLRRQLSAGNIETLLVNGKSVWEALKLNLGRELSWAKFGTIEGLTHQPCDLFGAVAFGRIHVIAWSTNRQSSFGVRAGFDAELASRIQGYFGSSVAVA